MKKIRIKDNSTVGREEYIWDHVLFGGIFGYNVYKLLPVVVPIAHYHQSLVRIILCMVITSIICIGITYKYNRTNMGMAADIFIGLGSYIMLTIGGYKRELIKALVYVSAVLTVLGIYTIFSSKIKRPDKFKQIILNRIRRSFLLVRRNAGVACAFTLFIVPTAVHFTSSETIANRYYDITGHEVPSSPFEDSFEVVQAYDDRYMLSENIDVIKKIRRNDEFQALSYEEKCEVVTAIVYNQARYLGLCEINLEFKELRNNTLGQYNHSTRTITINSRPLKDGTLDGGSNEEILNTVCHESRHCYQHLLMECYVNSTPEERNLYAYTSEGVDCWIDNINHYITCDDDSDISQCLDYANQPVEVDARSWAESEVNEYFYYIDKYAFTSDVE